MRGVVCSLSSGPGGELDQQEHSTEDLLESVAYGYVMLWTHFHQCVFCIQFLQLVSMPELLHEICPQTGIPASRLSKLGKVHWNTLNP